MPTTMRVAADSPMATRPTECTLPMTRITSAAPAAEMGRRNPVGLGAVSGLAGRTRIQAAMDASTVATGQAIACRMNPVRVAPKEFCNR